MDRYEILNGMKPPKAPKEPPFMNPINDGESFSPPPWEMSDVVQFETAKELFGFMASDGGPWIPADDPTWRWLGYSRDGVIEKEIMHVGIKFTDLKNTMSSLRVEVVEAFKTQDGRRKLGAALSRS